MAIGERGGDGVIWEALCAGLALEQGWVREHDVVDGVSWRKGVEIEWRSPPRADASDHWHSELLRWLNASGCRVEMSNHHRPLAWLWTVTPAGAGRPEDGRGIGRSACHRRALVLAASRALLGEAELRVAGVS